MNRSLTLSIPNPCSQKWNSFAPAQGGGFCSACSKVVVDFTKMSDDQMIEYFANAKGQTCGRFLPDQLKTIALRPPVKVQPGWMLLKAGVISILLLVVSKPSHAQLFSRKSKTELVSGASQQGDTTLIKFKGVVKDAQDQSPLPGINVVVKGTTIGTTTDAEGRFEIPERVKNGDVLVFSFIGFVSKEYQIDRKKDAGFEVPMQLCMDYDISVLGEVQVDGLYTETRNRSLWSRIKSLF